MMGKDVYKKLARHLDNLPAGYPVTETGVELRILKKLFTPNEAKLALHTTLIPEEAKVIARRAGLDREDTERRLKIMADKGLIFSIEFPKKPVVFMAAQYAVGIWEYQVNNLDEELVRDMNEYLPTFINMDDWKKAPQLRTIPVGRSLDASAKVLAYEAAEALVKKQKKLWVAPCICRREHKMVGKGCEKPEESCLIFGLGAYYYERRGIGREIDQEECVAILKRADKAGLVLQPNNAKKLNNICCCCGCCCQVLLNIKRHPTPAEIVSTPYTAEFNPETCKACGVCEKRCQMEAVVMKDDQVTFHTHRCIGCGLCVSTCPTKSFKMIRKEENRQAHIPENNMENLMMLGRVRGKLNKPKMIKMSLKSRWDRWLTR